MENKKAGTTSLAKKMGISLICGLAAGIALMFVRESMNSSGNQATWAMINSILFQDITAQGAESALGIFYIIGPVSYTHLTLPTIYSV